MSTQTSFYLRSFLNNELNLRNLKSEFTLNSIQRLLGLLGHPEKKLKIIHIAGSKGKGSTCAITAQILKEAGFRVGLYTSPHLDSFRERIRILDKTSKKVKKGDSHFKKSVCHLFDVFGDQITEKELEAAIKKIDPYVKKIAQLTFFELMTAIAFYYFAQEKVDFVVLETGLGGRLDATNVAPSLIAAITPISLEHTDILGKTIAAIAAEKAAIIKDRKQKVVLAPQHKDAVQVFLHRCRTLAIKPKMVGQDIIYTHHENYLSGQSFDVKTKKFSLKNLVLPLLGEHQMANAATAIGIIECLLDLGYDVQPQAIFEGCQNVFWPGRFEIIQKKRTYVLDGAHNEASIKTLANNVRDVFAHNHVVVILGVSADKNIERICKALSPIASKVIITKAKHPRAADVRIEEVGPHFPKVKILKTADVNEAIKEAARNTRSNDVILITGSLFVVAEIRNLIRNG